MDSDNEIDLEQSEAGKAANASVARESAIIDHYRRRNSIDKDFSPEAHHALERRT